MFSAAADRGENHLLHYPAPQQVPPQQKNHGANSMSELATTRQIKSSGMLRRVLQRMAHDVSKESSAFEVSGTAHPLTASRATGTSDPSTQL